MLSRWLARIKIDPDTLRQQKWFALFGERLLTPALWQGGTRALSGAVAAGLFASWIPIPMHSLVAVVLALAFRLNLPLALLAVWFNNPLTLPFMYLYAYRTGCLVLHQTPEPFHLTWSLHWLEHEAAGKDLVCTVGQFHTDTEVHTMTKIPGELWFSMDIRSEDNEVLLAIDRRLRAGQAIVIHCRAGLGRAPSLAICALIVGGIVVSSRR